MLVEIINPLTWVILYIVTGIIILSTLIRANILKVEEDDDDFIIVTIILYPLYLIVLLATYILDFMTNSVKVLGGIEKTKKRKKR